MKLNCMIPFLILIWCITILQGNIIRQKRLAHGEPEIVPLQTNPMINEGLFEGDIKGVSHETIDQLVKRSNTLGLTAASPADGEAHESGAAVRDPFAIWPGRQLFYEITDVFSETEKKIIRESLAEYHQKTCIKMVPRTNQNDYVSVQKLGGCWSSVGRQGGMQELSLDKGCVEHSAIIHEFMHALGFFHEQSRWDRDAYVVIHKENILPNQEYNFKKYDLNTLKNLNTDYDYKSVMHYDKTAFSKNGRPTITATQPNVEFGSQFGLSDIDVLELQRMYDCDNTGPPAPPAPPAPPVPIAPISPGLIHSGSRLYGDYTQYNVNDAKECQQKCEEQIECAGMTFDTEHTYSFGNCFLCKLGYSVKHDETWSSWVKGAISIGSIRPGNRLYGHYTQYAVHDENECLKICKEQKECFGMTFDSSNSYAPNNCFLVNVDYKIKLDKPWSSWMKGNLQSGVHFREKAFVGIKKMKSILGCVQTCEAMSNCGAVNFYDGYYDSDAVGNCFLYTYSNAYTKRTDGHLDKWTAWVKGQ